MNILRVVSVTQTFQESAFPVTALEGVSLEIPEGAFTALCGPSGSGKTTLLNLLGCLSKPTQGKIFFDDTEVSHLSQKELTHFRLHKIGFIFQDYNLIPTFSAAENIEYPLWLQGVSGAERAKRALDLAKRFGIEKLLARKPHQLSRGQQQRVAVARALIHKPRLVLGDELTANLDHKTGTELMEFLKKLNQEEKITFIYATHDPVMIKYAERMITLEDGTITHEHAPKTSAHV
jgi:putative ABC transport system ATP-binding protein